MTKLEGQSLQLECNFVASIAAALVTKELNSMFESVQAEAGCYAFKSRQKSWPSIFTKVQRKRASGQAGYDQERDAWLSRPQAERPPTFVPSKEVSEALTYNPEHITDAWGCRLVTLFQSDIIKTIEVLLQKIERFNISHADAAPIRMREVVVYTNRPKTDPLSIVDDVVKMLNTSDLPKSVVVDDSIRRAPESRKSAYSSVHFVFEREIEVQLLQGKENRLAAFEVQIRDIFEEGWGEVQHNLLYSQKDAQDGAPNSDEMNALWMHHLNALKTFVDGCSQHASVIKAGVDSLKARRRGPGERQSTTDLSAEEQKIQRALNRAGASKDGLGTAVKAYTSMITAESESAGPERAKHYEQAAREFELALGQLSDQALASPVDGGCNYPVSFFLEAERANAVFLAAEDHVAHAGACSEECFDAFLLSRAQFSKLVTDYPADATLRFRLARTQARLDVHSRATGDSPSEDHLIAAVESLDACIAKTDADPLTGPEHWLGISARIEKGLYLWKLYNRSGGSDGELVSQATAASLEAYTFWLSQPPASKSNDRNSLAAHKALANLIYFAAKLTTVPSETERAVSLLNEYVPIVESFAVDTYKQFYRTRDNLMHGLQALGRLDDARAYARITFEELRSVAEERAGRPLDAVDIPSQLKGSEATCFGAAARVLDPANA